MNPRILLRGLLLIGSLALAGYALETTHLLSTFNETWIDTQVRGRGVSGQMLFIAVGALFAGVGMPRQVVCFLGGYGFGLSNGFLISLLASVIGCVGTFYYARLFGRRLITARFGRRIQKLDDFLRDNTFTMTLLARLLPIGSNLINNLVAGIAKVHALPFIAGSAVGYIPQTLVFALVGSGIALDPTRRIGLAILLFVVSGVLGVALYRKYRHGKNLDDDIERELGTETSP